MPTPTPTPTSMPTSMPTPTAAVDTPAPSTAAPVPSSAPTPSPSALFAAVSASAGSHTLPRTFDPPVRASFDSVFSYPSPSPAPSPAPVLAARTASIPTAPRWAASIDNLRAHSASQHALPWAYPHNYPAYGPGPDPASALAQAGADDDIIPNAIVIKNIPFSLPKESLSALMADLRLPQPYAFNYHFDQGLFRGLAFANFHSAEEADQVVVALQGFDVAGRKLKTEYKKVLQAGEKERIEKEKALKRMQSLQMEKENEQRRRQRLNALQVGIPPPGIDAAHSHSNSYSPLTTQVQVAATSLPSPLGISGMPSPVGISPSAPPGGATVGSPLICIPGRKDELNMNDSTTLDIFSRVVIFKEDRMRDELVFSKSLSPLERRVVHLVAQRLSLYHYSTGVADERCVVVSKVEPAGRARTQSTQSRRLRTKPSAPVLPSSAVGAAVFPTAAGPYGIGTGTGSISGVSDLLASQARLNSMRSFAALRRSADASARTTSYARAIGVDDGAPTLPEAGAMPSLLADLRLDGHSTSSGTSSDSPVQIQADRAVECERVQRSSPHPVATRV